MKKKPINPDIDDSHPLTLSKQEAELILCAVSELDYSKTQFVQAGYHRRKITVLNKLVDFCTKNWKL